MSWCLVVLKRNPLCIPFSFGDFDQWTGRKHLFAVWNHLFQHFCISFPIKLKNFFCKNTKMYKNTFKGSLPAFRLYSQMLADTKNAGLLLGKSLIFLDFIWNCTYFCTVGIQILNGWHGHLKTGPFKIWTFL